MRDFEQAFFEAAATTATAIDPKVYVKKHAQELAMQQAFMTDNAQGEEN